MSDNMKLLMTDELAKMEADAALLESSGHKRLADRVRRDVAGFRKRVAAEDAQRAVADERMRGVMRGFVDDLERRVGR